MSIEHDDTECEHLLEAAALSAQLIEALKERDEARARCIQRNADFCAMDAELTEAKNQCDEARSVLADLVEICQWLRPQLPRGIPPWRQLDEATAFLARMKGTP